VTGDLVERLRSALDERERVAREAQALNDDAGRWTQVDPDREPGRIVDGHGEVVTYDEGAPLEVQAAHIAANDPAHVLRIVLAHREILALFEGARSEVREHRVGTPEHQRAADSGLLLNLVIMKLAAIYLPDTADHIHADAPGSRCVRCSSPDVAYAGVYLPDIETGDTA
jgi:hypothetical protein